MQMKMILKLFGHQKDILIVLEVCFQTRQLPLQQLLLQRNN